MASNQTSNLLATEEKAEEEKQRERRRERKNRRREEMKRGEKGLTLLHLGVFGKPSWVSLSGCFLALAPNTTQILFISK